MSSASASSRAAARSRRARPGRPDQDHHRGQRTGPQHPRLWRRRRRARSRRAARRPRGRAADVRGSRARDRRHRAGADRRLHDGAAWAWGSAARDGCRTSSSIQSRGGRGNARRDRTLEMTMRAVVIETPARSRRRAGAVAAASASASTRAHAGRVAIVATELATNLLKHGERRRAAGRHLRRSVGHGRRVIALDKGPGIANIGAAMRDGHSTGGTPAPDSARSRRQSQLMRHRFRDRGAGPRPGPRSRPTAAPTPPPRSATRRRQPADAGRRGVRRRLVPAPVTRTRWTADGGGWPWPWPVRGRRRPTPRSGVRIAAACPPANSAERMHRPAADARRRRFDRAHRRRGQIEFSGDRQRRRCIVGGRGPRRHGVVQRHRWARGPAHPAFTYRRGGSTLRRAGSDGLGTSWSLDGYPGPAAAASQPDRRRAVPRLQPGPRRCDGAGRPDERRHESWPLLTVALEHEGDVVAGAGSGPGASPSCWASTRRTRPGSPRRYPRSPATHTLMDAAAAPNSCSKAAVIRSS